MNNSGGWRGLGGASKKEATREDVLQQALVERAARAAARQQQRAATIISACFRGHIARRKLRQSLLAEWHSKFATLAAQADAQPLPAADTAAAMRLLLMALLPFGSTHSNCLLASGETPAAVASAGVSSALRGTLALVLRHKHAPAEPELQVSWQLQAGQLCLLCCLVTAAGSAAPDMLLDAASTRLLQRMTSQDYWAAAGPNSSSSQGPGAAAVLARLAAHPAPLLRALQRLAAANSTQPTPAAQPPHAAARLNAATVTASSLQRLATVMTTLLDGSSSSNSSSSSSLGSQQQQEFVDAAVLLAFTAPGLAAALPAASRAQLAQQHLMRDVLLPTAQALAESGQLAGTAAVHCLANLCQLLTGCGPTPLPQRQVALSSMSDCCLAVHTGLAVAYVNTAVSLLGSASRKPSGSRHCSTSSQQQQQEAAAAVLADGCWMLGTRQHLVQLLQVLSSELQQQQDGLVLWAAYCVHLLQDGEQLQARPDTAASGSGAAAVKGLPAAVLNVLSFAPDLLPRLWHWLAMNAGLPLEAPLQASRGLDIAAVSCGPDGLRPDVALVMGLFVRSLAQLLLVLDDVDLHQQQKPFSLGASRAIASTLNSLVFHTCFPEPHKSPQQQWQRQQAPGAPATRLAASTIAHGRALLARHAAGCLRQWYDRDARQQFCQPNLWTEPYSNLMAAQQGGATTTTAAVVQALLVGVGLADEAAAAPLATPAPAAAGSGGSSLRTAALLSLLRCAPQCVPFDVRLELFRQMLQQDKVAGRYCLSPMEGGPRPIKLTVRRDALLEDAFRGLAAAGPAIKARLQVTFTNAAGLEEAGLDQGGLMKELLEKVVLAATQPEYGLFTATEDTGLLFPNPAAEAIPQGLALLEFVGLVAGKALYEGILLDLCFAPFFVRSLQGAWPGLDDLATLDASLHANLVSLKSCPADDVQHLGLTFLAEQQLLGRTIESELLPGGASLPVTAENRLMYMHLLADWHLNARLGRTAAAFARGLSHVLAPSWLKLFSPAELNELISGGRGSGLDVADMARYARYSNGYSATSSTVKMFWRVVSEMTPDQRSALLRFITSSSKAPLGGFKHLTPPLTIAKVDCGSSPLAFLGGKDVDRLPSASTCFNMLKLPNYKRAATMKERLLYAIRAGSGFELS